MQWSTSTLVALSAALLCGAVPATESTGGLSDSRLQLNSGTARRARHYSSLSSSIKDKMNDLNQRASPSEGVSPVRSVGSPHFDRHARTEGNEHLGNNMSRTIEEAIAHAKLSHKASLKKGSTVQYVKAVRVPDHTRSEIEKRRKPKLLNVREPRRNDGWDEETHKFVKSLISEDVRDHQNVRNEFFEQQPGWPSNSPESLYKPDSNFKMYPFQFKNQQESFEPMPYIQKQKFYQNIAKDDTEIGIPRYSGVNSESAHGHWWEESPSVHPSGKPFSANHEPDQAVPITTFRPSIRYLDLVQYSNGKKSQNDSFRPMRESRERHSPKFYEKVDLGGGRVHKQLRDDYEQKLQAHSVSPDDAYPLKSAVSPTPVYYPHSYRKKLDALKRKEGGTTNVNLKQPVIQPPTDGLEKAQNSIEKDIIADTEPIFQDVRTHPVEKQYYSALEDEIRKSPFLTESVRLVSSDSFRDLVKRNKTTKKFKNKTKSLTKLETLPKSEKKYSSTRRRKTEKRQKVGSGNNKQKKLFSTKSATKETTDPLYDETQKWQDYYRGLRYKSKLRYGKDQQNLLKTYEDYPASRNPSVSEGYYQNWNTVPRSFLNEPQQYNDPNLDMSSEENKSFAEYEDSNEINLNENSDSKLRKSAKDYNYSAKSSKFSKDSQMKKSEDYDSTVIKYGEGSGKSARPQKSSGVAHEYHNSHLFSELPYGYDEKRRQQTQSDVKNVPYENVRHNKDEGTMFGSARTFADLQGNADNREKYPLDYENFAPIRDDYYDYYKMYDDRPDQYYDYASSYYDSPAKDDAYWDYSYPVKGLLSGLYLSRMSEPRTIKKHGYEPYLNIPTIDDQYNFKSNSEKSDDAYQKKFSSSINSGRPHTSSATPQSGKQPTLIPKTNAPVVLVTRHSEQHSARSGNNNRTIERENKLSDEEAMPFETDRREEDFVTSVKPLNMPDVSTESKLISRVLAQSSIFRSMASSAKPEVKSSDQPQNMKTQDKSSPRESVRRSPIPRLLWKGREIPRHPISPRPKPEDISYGWHPIPSPYPQKAAASTKKNTVVFSSMPFTNL